MDVFFLVALLAPVVAPYPAGQTFLDLIQKPQAPLAAHHLLGTDVLGHDFTDQQLIFAVRETMLSAFFCAALATVIGGVVGIISGYSGGWFDGTTAFVMRVVMSVPASSCSGFVSTRYPLLLTPLQNAFWLSLILGRASRASSPRRLRHCGTASSSRPRARRARRLRGSCLVTCCRTSPGRSSWRRRRSSPRRYIVATVQYLGYSAYDAHQPTLGGLVADATTAQSQILTHTAGIGEVWWLYALPAAVLVVLLLAVTFLGDSLDEALNPAS